MIIRLEQHLDFLLEDVRTRLEASSAVETVDVGSSSDSGGGRFSNDERSESVEAFDV